MPYDSQDLYEDPEYPYVPHVGSRYNYPGRNFRYGSMPDSGTSEFGDRASRLFVYKPQQIVLSLDGFLGGAGAGSWNRVQTFTQSAQFNGTAGLNTAVALGAPVAVGDTIVLETTVGADPNGLATCTLLDQLGNVYNRLSAAQGGQLFDASNGQGDDSWWCIVTVAGTPTITYTPDPAVGVYAWKSIKGSHFTGSDASSTRRDSKGALQASPGLGANAITTASIGAQAGDLLWGASGRPGTGSSGTEAAGTGFTGSVIDATSSFIDEWKTATGAGAATFTDATAGSSSTYMTMGIAITPGAGGGPALSGSVDTTKQYARTPSGGFTPAGALSTTYIPGLISATLGGAVTFVGALIKQTKRNLAGAFTPGGIVQKLISRVLAGGFVPSGTVQKQISRSLAAALTFVGTLLHNLAKVLSGGFTPSGTTTKQTNRNLVAGFTPGGVVVKQTRKTADGTLPSSGALVKQTRRTLGGGFTPGGTLSTFKVRLIALAAAIVPSGILTKLTQRNLSGGSSPTGTVTKRTFRTMAGAILPVGAISRFLSKVLAGGLIPSGALSTFRLKLITLLGSVAHSGTVQRQTAKTTQGSIAPSGAVSRRTFRTLAAQIGLSGQLTRFIQKTFGGLLVPQGILTWQAIGHDFLILLVGTQGARYILGALSAVRYRLESKSQSRYGPTHTGEASDEIDNTSSSKDDL